MPRCALFSPLASGHAFLCPPILAFYLFLLLSLYPLPCLPSTEPIPNDMNTLTWDSPRPQVQGRNCSIRCIVQRNILRRSGIEAHRLQYSQTPGTSAPGLDSPIHALLIFQTNRSRVEAGLGAGLDSPMQPLLVFETSRSQVGAESRRASRQASTFPCKPC